MKTYLRVEVWVHEFLTLVLDGGEWSPSCSSYFSLGIELLVLLQEAGWEVWEKVTVQWNWSRG